MKKILFLLAFCGLSISSQAQMDQTAQRFAATITPEDLRQHLYKLTSTEFEGRETGTEGQRRAADYLAAQMQSWNLPAIGENGSYFQYISFTNQSWRKIQVKDQNKELRHLWDYYTYPATNPKQFDAKFEDAIFLGFGIDEPAYSDYQGVNVKGKLVVVYDGEPTKGGKSLVSGSEAASAWASDWRKKARAAKANGAAALFIIDRKFKENVAEARKAILNSRNDMAKDEDPENNFAPNYFITTDLAKSIFGDKVGEITSARDKIAKKGKPRNVSFKCAVNILAEKNYSQLKGSNVLGFIEGTDPKLKDEFVVVTAHYDHLGKRGDDIYFGADDNASGSSTVLEICQAMVEAKKAGTGPRRSVLCMLVSGEEKGLLGSQFYAAFPIFPLHKTVANVNVDMVGRVDEEHKDKPDYIYVIGADRLSSELHQINEQANATYTKLVLDYKYNEESDPNRYYYRSDHYNFAKNGIPAIFYFNGTHADYHRTSDTPDKINFEKMAKIGHLIFYTAWELANRDQRIKVDKK
jgi:hypothetical protein